MLGGSGSEGSSGLPMSPVLNLSPAQNSPRSLRPPLWKDKRFAVSFTWDDGYEDHLVEVCPLLDSHGFKGTFYVGMPSLLAHSNAWKLVHDVGHEIGNHTVFHPGPRNSAFNGKYNLESMSRRDMEWELDTAQMLAEKVTGERPKTFAYPHGCHHIGHGATADSYYPLVASRFVGARGTANAEPNQLERCNLHMLSGFPLDGLLIERAKTMLDYAENDGLWLVFYGHHIGEGNHVQSVNRDVFKAVLDAVGGRDCWVDTISNIASYVASSRNP